MAFTGKVLGDGQLPTTKGTLYTVPAGTTTYVKRISFFNTNAASQTILVYINPGATSRTWRRYVLAQDEAVDLLDHGDALILQEGDLIEAHTTTGSAVDYFLMGIEETA
jgi:hypothetical protein